MTESNSSSNKKKNAPNVSAPKNFLVPILLLHLREWNVHGYELMEKLTKFGIDSLNQGNFYRLLRQLEKDSLVTSFWDTTSDGPAKRIYSITEAGEQYLDMWAGPLSEYQKMLNQFFNLYNPFYPKAFSNTTEKEVVIVPEEKVVATQAESSTVEVAKPVAKAPTRRRTSTRTTKTTKPRATKKTASSDSE